MKKPELDRRDFIKGAVVGAAAATAITPVDIAQAEPAPAAQATAPQAAGYEFLNLDEAAFIDLPTRTANPARRGRDARFAIERFREDPRECRFTDAARPGKQIGVMQTAAVERVRERAHNVLLSDERSEILRPPFACENLIGHPEIVSVTMARKTDSGRRPNARHGHDDAPPEHGERSIPKLGMMTRKLLRIRENGCEEKSKGR